MPSTSSAPDAARSLTRSTRDAAAACAATAAPGDAGRRGLRPPPGGANGGGGGGGLSTISSATAHERTSCFAEQHPELRSWKELCCLRSKRRCASLTRSGAIKIPLLGSGLRPCPARARARALSRPLVHPMLSSHPCHERARARSGSARRAGAGAGAFPAALVRSGFHALPASAPALTLSPFHSLLGLLRRCDAVCGAAASVSPWGCSTQACFA